jgi:3D (Asp-Asp-Asp) domain-containing protein
MVRITRVIAWQRKIHRAIAMPTIQKLDFALAPGVQHVATKGRMGLREELVAFEQRDGGPVTARVIHSRVIRKPRTRVVDIGVSEMQAYEHFASAGVRQAGVEMRSTLSMIATAYTSGCAGCSGITAIGRPAGHGIVAVDPSVIPLGTKFFIPGYGFAIAGDTGGAIIGNRIDLGFDSLRDALIFGRREVTVYRLK